jgi:hypothetical protein
MQIREYRAGSTPPENDWEKNTDKNFDAMAQDLCAILNEGLRVTDNMEMSIVTVTTDAVAGTETAVVHGLGYTPNGYIVISKDKAAHIYNATAPTATNVYVKSDVASVTVKLLIL